MAAATTVPQVSFVPKFETVAPRSGVVMLSGYGVSASVDRGHLVLRDGVGRERRAMRLARIGHGLRRLLILGTDGVVSLAALRWLNDQRVPFALVEREGQLLATSTPPQSRDARLRRAQSFALQSGVGLHIVKGLLARKLTAQGRIARMSLRREDIGSAIAKEVACVNDAPTIEALRWTEARAALAYWSAWHDLPIVFPTQSLRRVPAHWRVFGARRSPLTGSPRLAVNPPNAMLNYLYAILEWEARTAAIAVGLDPAIGLMHADTDARDSLACDLMEGVRPEVDAFLLSWLAREPLRREWFFEERNGNCRLTAALALRLGATGPLWARLLGPVARKIASDLSSAQERAPVRRGPTPPATMPANKPQALPHTCRECGNDRPRGQNLCLVCARAAQTKTFTVILAKARAGAHNAAAQESRAHTTKRNAIAVKLWEESGEPRLAAKVYDRNVLPLLSHLKTAAIASALQVSESYAAQIRKGERRPHQRHWPVLSRLLATSRRLC